MFLFATLLLVAIIALAWQRGWVVLDFDRPEETGGRIASTMEAPEEKAPGFIRGLDKQTTDFLYAILRFRTMGPLAITSTQAAEILPQIQHLANCLIVIRKTEHEGTVVFTTTQVDYIKDHQQELARELKLPSAETPEEALIKAALDLVAKKSGAIIDPGSIPPVPQGPVHFTFSAIANPPLPWNNLALGMLKMESTPRLALSPAQAKALFPMFRDLYSAQRTLTSLEKKLPNSFTPAQRRRLEQAGDQIRSGITLPHASRSDIDPLVIGVVEYLAQTARWPRRPLISQVAVGAPGTTNRQPAGEPSDIPAPQINPKPSLTRSPAPPPRLPPPPTVGPAPSPSVSPAPAPTVSPAPPPVVHAGIPLNDLLWAILKFEQQPGLALTPAQARKIIPLIKPLLTFSPMVHAAEIEVLKILTQRQISWLNSRPQAQVPPLADSTDRLDHPLMHEVVNMLRQKVRVGTELPPLPRGLASPAGSGARGRPALQWFDLMVGLLTLEGKNDLAVSEAQAVRMLPVVERVRKGWRSIMQAEDRLPEMLSRRQLEYVTSHQDELKSFARNTPLASGAAGTDPLVGKVLKLLAARAGATTADSP